MRDKVIKIAISLALVLTIFMYDRFFTISLAIANTQYAIYINDVFYGNVADREEYDKYVNTQLKELNDSYEYGPVYAPTNYKIQGNGNTFDTELTDEEVFEIFKRDIKFLVDGYKTTIIYNADEEVSEGEEHSGYDSTDIYDVQLKESDQMTVIYTSNKQDIDLGFERLLQTFIDPIDIEMIRESKVPGNIKEPGTDVTKAFNVKGQISGREQLVPLDLILKGDELYNYLLFSVDTDEDKKYIVKPGDTLESIANENMLNVKELIAANEKLVNENTIIAPGQELVVSLVSPVFNVETTRLVVREELIPYETVVEEDPNKYNTEPVEVVQEGKEGVVVKAYEMEYLNGQVTNQATVVHQEVVVPVQNRHVIKGTKRVVISGSYKSSRVSVGVAGANTTVAWGRVLQGGILTSKYGYRWGRLHAGIDIAGVPRGTSTLAAADGVVTAAVYSPSGLGYHVVIDHENGFVTVYGHHDSLDVTGGQRVVRGQRLGGMGNTGYSKGAHLHFEVWRNGINVNPVNIYGGFY